MTTDKATIIYDGECHFCIEQIERIRSMDKLDQFEYVPRQVPDFAQRFPFLKEMNLEEGMRVVTPDGCVYTGADSVYEIARRLPWPRLIAWLYRLPLFNQLGRLAYRWIAANRQRIGRTCKEAICKVHDAAGETSSTPESSAGTAGGA